MGERQEEGREKERRAEEGANDEEDRAKAGRSLLQLRERCTHASDGGRIGGQEGWIRVVDLNALQKK